MNIYNINSDFVRKQFPALRGDWVFFDNAGGTQTLGRVADKIRDYLLTTNVQLGASYDVSQQSVARVNEGIDAMTAMINAPDRNEIILGASTSLLLRNLSVSLGNYFKPGDEIIVTNCDHEANIGPWRSLEKRGMRIKEWRLNPDTLAFHLEDLEPLMTAKTRLVAVTHTSNILGTINPIRRMASFVHERGALICVDGVAYAPHRRVDVRELDVDFYVFSLYKVYGPHCALLYGKKEILEKIPGINHFFLEDTVPYKLQPGGVNMELTYGLTGITDYFTELAALHADGEDLAPVNGIGDAVAVAFAAIANHEEALSARLLDFLTGRPNVRIIGKAIPDREARVPTVSFVVNGRKSSEFPPEVDKYNIGIRYGDFYARRLIDDLGLAPQDGVIRVSMVHYNTIEEIDRLIKILEVNI
ncbi:MAG: cysteine desulfurase-like protein [Candidatus Omnitrophota bacterium]